MTLTPSDRELMLDMHIQPETDGSLDVAGYVDRLYWENVGLRDALYFSRNIAWISWAATGIGILVWALT